METHKSAHKTVPSKEKSVLLETLKKRFEGHMERHETITWNEVAKRLESNEEALFSLQDMEKTKGEPDVVSGLSEGNELVFADCSPQSPAGRRKVCYDDAALKARKKFPPETSALAMAESMGIKILDENEYKILQKFGEFDTKTSSWIETSEKIRQLGGALYCDRRYDTVFVYHNGAESYYSSRGFRGSLKV